VVSDVEAVHGVAPDGVHLGRHNVQVDVLQHTHNVCAEMKGQKTKKKGGRKAGRKEKPAVRGG
jgi:hypothetical protein